MKIKYQSVCVPTFLCVLQQNWKKKKKKKLIKCIQQKYVRMKKSKVGSGMSKAGSLWSSVGAIIPYKQRDDEGCVRRMPGLFVKPAWHLHLFYYLWRWLLRAERRRFGPGSKSRHVLLGQRLFDEKPTLHMCTMCHHARHQRLIWKAVKISALFFSLKSNTMEAELKEWTD